MPFFFVGIGLKMVPGDFPQNLGPALALFGVAVLGKFLTMGGVGLLMLPPNDAALLGVSMIPRAEIALVIMQHSARLGSWAVPTHAFSALVLVSALTCAITPLLLRPLLRLWKTANAVETKTDSDATTSR